MHQHRESQRISTVRSLTARSTISIVYSYAKTCPDLNVCEIDQDGKAAKKCQNMSLLDQDKRFQNVSELEISNLRLE